MQFYITVLTILTLTLSTLTLTHDTAESLCKGAPPGSLRCCSTASYIICSASNNSTCRPNPFPGVCINDALDIHVPDTEAAFEAITAAGIMPTHIAAIRSYLNNHPSPTTTTTSEDIIVKRDPRHTSSATSKKKAMPSHNILATKPVKVLGLSSPDVPQATCTPPMPCQIIGNVVLDRCDWDNAVFDHWYGDQPCEYPT
jgi:hypothetical protein